jgi:hypothetical protein
MTTQSLDIPIYGRRFHIIITGDFSKDYSEINKKLNQNLDESDNVLGMSQMRGAHHMIIINVGRHRKVYKGIEIECELADTISHEADHLCNQLFKSIGATVDVNNDEPHAYLLGWTVKQITRNYLKFKEKENGKKV